MAWDLNLPGVCPNRMSSIAAIASMGWRSQPWTPALADSNSFGSSSARSNTSIIGDRQMFAVHTASIANRR